MCVYVCICMYMCVYVCICVYMCVYVCICVYMCVYVCICVYMCVCVCMYVCMFVDICVYIYVCVYICVYVWVWVWVCVCVYDKTLPMYMSPKIVNSFQVNDLICCFMCAVKMQNIIFLSDVISSGKNRSTKAANIELRTRLLVLVFFLFCKTGYNNCPFNETICLKLK